MYSTCILVVFKQGVDNAFYKCWVLVFSLVFILFILTSSGSLAGSKDTVLVGELYHPTTIDPFQYRGSKDEVVFGTCLSR